MNIPEKWCIKLTEENKEAVTNWCNTNLVEGELENYTTLSLTSLKYIHSEEVEWGCIYKRGKDNWLQHDDYTEITYDQFKKYVLKQQEEDYSYLIKVLEKWNIK